MICLPSRFISLLACCLMSGATAVHAADRPNILFILADDLSWSDLGRYGHRYHQTPNLDRLAKEGLRFTQAYAPAPICSASRAAILTGRTPARLNFEFVTKQEAGRQKLGQPLQSPPFTLNLPLEEITMPEMLSAAGYHTAFFGKWHLNQHHGGYLGWSPSHGPLQQGFTEGDSDFGSHPYAYLKQEGRDFLDLPEGEYPQDTLTNKVTGFLQRKHEQPFLLYWSQYFVHDPVHTRSRWLFEKYRRALPADIPDERAAYAAMVETLDHQVGRMLEVLKQTGLAENTLVVFMSDNGGHPNYAANGPLRGSKWNLYEGGIRVPMIARWPGHINAGGTCDQPVHGCDLLPTFAALAGAATDGSVPLDGMDITALLREPNKKVYARPLLWHFPYYHPEKGFQKAPAKIGTDDFVTSQTRPHSAIRLGRYKLLRFDEDGRDELYDLSADPSESSNLAADHPELVTQLRGQLTSLLKESNARLATPAGKKAKP
ncbi:sulfatase [Prosthecobacter sp. SYSU 5D2]|uniref:sulfatase n=1 Tax=Prosthecobacter sp. SYSU 5D2 TaxID=3134134 RepID=UPI0031FE58D1